MRQSDESSSSRIDFGLERAARAFSRASFHAGRSVDDANECLTLTISSYEDLAHFFDIDLRRVNIGQWSLGTALYGGTFIFSWTIFMPRRQGYKWTRKARAFFLISLEAKWIEEMFCLEHNCSLRTDWTRLHPCLIGLVPIGDIA